ncbi:MAG: hypothetical protein KDJ47_06505 [Hyphomicrobiaceae bacterium]|nr:hypothetical protein [Hyphomicrobiaceae bacterium]
MSRLVIIDRRLSLPEAVVMASMLGAYRVPAWLGGTDIAFMSWLTLWPMGGVAVHVMETDAALAAALLRPVDPNKTLRESRSFWSHPIRHALAASLIVFGLPFPVWLANRRLWSSSEADTTPAGKA